MKYIITESQNETLIKIVNELLNFEFREKKVVCKIVVVPIYDDELGEDEKDLLFDIFVTLNNSFINLSGAGMYGFRLGTEKLITRCLKKWIGLNSNQFSINFHVADCTK